MCSFSVKMWNMDLMPRVTHFFVLHVLLSIPQMLLSFKGHQVMYIIFLVPCTEVTYEKVFSYTVIK